MRAPTLMVQSRHDNRIAPPAAEAAFHRLGAGERELAWADECGHVLSVDFGHDTTYARTAAWLERHLPAVPGPRTRAVTRA